MKIILSFLLCLSFSRILFAQHAQTAPLILQGKITNSPEKILEVFFEDELGKVSIDTIVLNEAGAFYLKTYKIKKPQRTNIQHNGTQLNGVFVAPGYDLTITGDGTDFLSLFKSKKITGIGSETNKYRIVIDSIYAARNDKTRWQNLKLEALLQYIKKTKSLGDSVVNVVFNKKPEQDKFFESFKNMIQIDNESMAFYSLLNHILASNYNYEKATGLVKDNMPARFANGISKDEFLSSQDYKTSLLGTYLAYLKKIDEMKDSTVASQPNYILHKIMSVYKGKVRDFYLYEVASSSIARSHSVEMLNSNKKSLAPYLASFKSKGYINELNNLFVEKERQVMLMQIGKPAPQFELKSSTNKSYSLADFKGKVIYIDLWASWCVPCRAEMPNYKKLYQKYKDNNQVVFVGIAVSDSEKEWRKALQDDKPEWLQLFDESGFVSKSYIANTIPKYILIDKNGDVADFDAPGPGTAEIEKLLESLYLKKL